MKNKLLRLIRIAAFFAKLCLATLISKFMKLSKKYRNLWIIAERGDDARDNGYFFYKYMRENHPEVNLWYAIKSDSADCKKIEALGNRVETDSFKHFLIYCASTVRISSSMWGGDLPYSDYFNKIRKYMSKKRKFVFLKHGIVKDFLPQHCAVSGTPDIYVCGAKPEYDYASQNFGHKEGVVKYTGLARFDNLHGIKTKDQILLMPTFRRWLQKMTAEEVSASEYIAAWNKILCDQRIIAALEESGLDLIFYPHYVMQKHINGFKAESERVKIAKFKDYDVQQLLIESKLLVTDFSSVFFDFGYMNKPTVYYQFDRERYINEHYDYTKGYFDYDEMGFGEVCLDHEAIVDAICKSIGRNFALSEKYQERINKFFPLQDKNNCERIFGEINSLLK